MLRIRHRSNDIMRSTTLTVLALAAPLSTEAQSRITIGTSTHVSTDARKVPHAETFVAVNPRNSRNIIAAASTVSREGWHNVVYSSSDGGKTWTRAHLRAISPRPLMNGDPVVYFDDMGTAYYSEIAIFPGGTTFAYRSLDGGRGWEGPFYVPGINDRQYMVIDTTR